MHIQADRALVPANAPSIRYLQVLIGALAVAARDVVFEVACDPGIEAMVVNGLPTSQVEGRMQVQVGDLAAEQETTLIVAVAFKGSHQEGSSLGVQCRVIDRERVLHPEPIAVTWRAVTAVENNAQPVNHAVRLALATLLADRARVMARDASRRDDFDDARRILRVVVDDLRALAPGDKDVLAIIDRLHHDELELGEGR